MCDVEEEQIHHHWESGEERQRLRRKKLPSGNSVEVSTSVGLISNADKESVEEKGEAMKSSTASTVGSSGTSRVKDDRVWKWVRVDRLREVRQRRWMGQVYIRGDVVVMISDATKERRFNAHTTATSKSWRPLLST